MTYLIIIRGPLGSGKTTIAKELAKKLNAKYFSIDDTIDENKLADDKEQGYISQKSFHTANEILIPQINKTLAQNIPVVIDGNFYWKTQIEDLLAKTPILYSH